VVGLGHRDVAFAILKVSIYSVFRAARLGSRYTTCECREPILDLMTESPYGDQDNDTYSSDQQAVFHYVLCRLTMVEHVEVYITAIQDRAVDQKSIRYCGPTEPLDSLL
jgi:hypothetical protein